MNQVADPYAGALGQQSRGRSQILGISNLSFPDRYNYVSNGQALVGQLAVGQESNYAYLLIDDNAKGAMVAAFAETSISVEA